MSVNDVIAQLPHKILPDIRQAKHLSTKQVADALYVHQQVIELLEKGVYEELFGDAYVCGLVRAYATLLDIDAESMIIAYKQSGYHEKPKQELGPLVIAAYPKLQHKTYKTIYGLIIVIVVVIVFGVIANQKTQLHQSVKALEVMPIIAPVIDASSSTLIPPTEVNAVETNINTNVRANTNTAVLNGVSTSELLDVETSTLIFTFTDDCWVEVIDINGTVLLTAIQKANQTAKIKGLAPFKVTLGNAPAVSLLFNNTPVSITADPSKTAKFIVGKS